MSRDQDIPHERTEPSRKKVPLVTYANNIMVRSSAYDVAFTFGLDVGDSIRTLATVFMSPQHAKSLKLLLDKYIGDYESTIGEIALPSDVIETLRSSGPTSESESEPS